jgi:ABC-type multidrug transport system fused ATPase/permease subunit
MFFQGGFTFPNFVMDLLTVFIFVIWFWLLITVFGDLFRRHDISGWTKAIWVIVLILFPYIAVLVYLIAQGRGMAQRRAQVVQHEREELRHMVGYSVADELGKLDALRNSGSITPDEYTRLRARVVE